MTDRCTNIGELATTGRNGRTDNKTLNGFNTGIRTRRNYWQTTDHDEAKRQKSLYHEQALEDLTPSYYQPGELLDKSGQHAQQAQEQDKECTSEIKRNESDQEGPHHFVFKKPRGHRERER
jgi:hypothetical protein